MKKENCYFKRQVLIKKEIQKFTDKSEEEAFIKNLFKETINSGLYETNEIIVAFLKRFFAQRVIINNLNMISLIEDVAHFDGKGWVLENEKL